MTDPSTVSNIALAIVGGGGVAVGAGLIKLSNTVASLAAKQEAMDSRLARIEDHYLGNH